jgi:hypothetical protein
MVDVARSNVYEDVVHEKNVRTSIRMLEQNDPTWRNKQTLEHTGTLNLTAGLMSKEQIAAMSDDDLKKMITVRKAELAALGADDVRSEARPANRNQSAD